MQLRTILALVLVPSLAGIASRVAAGDLDFGPPQLLPGDAAPGPAEGHQMEAAVARGDGMSLAVWSDYRSSPDDYPPFASEGTGSDVYAARIDADGNVIDTSPLVVNHDFDDQVEPQVAWNGANWLVVWKTQTVALPTYERLMGARVAPDGTVLDDPPLELYDDQAFLYGWRVAGGANGWVVMLQATGNSDGLFARRVAGNGTLPGSPVQVLETFFLNDFDLAFAGDEYLLAWAGPFDAPRGRRYTSSLTPLDPAPFALPWVRRVVSDGTDFLVAWGTSSANGYAKGAIVTHGGTVMHPAGFDIATNIPTGACCVEAAWDGATYWVGWGGLTVARVTSSGHVLDPGGFTVGALGQYSVPWSLDGAPGGGLQVVWNDGEDGADYPKDVYATGVSPEGDVSSDTLLSAGAPAQLDADLAEGDGMFAVAFASRTSGMTRVMAQRLDMTGAAIDAEPLEIAAGPAVGSPGIGFDGTRYLVTWQDGDTVFARRLLADGTLLDDPPIEVMPGITPDVAGLDGTFLVADTHILLNNAQWRAAFTRRIDGASGALLDPEPQELGNFVIFSQFPHVVAFGDRWLVTWQTNISHDDPAASTKAAFVDLDGTSPGPFAVGLGWRPDVAVSGDRALFAAVTQTIASANNDIHGRIMLADGTFPGGAFTVSAAADRQRAPAVAFEGEDFIVAWEDKRNAVIYFDERTDIYGTRIAPDGTVLDPAGVPLATGPEPEIDAALISAGGTTLLATSDFRPGEGLCAYRIAVRAAGVPALEGDANADGRVDVMDLVEVITQWGPCPPPPDACSADVDGSGAVDVNDLVMVFENWS